MYTSGHSIIFQEIAKQGGHGGEIIGYYANAAQPHGPLILVGGGGGQDVVAINNPKNKIGNIKLSFGRFRIRQMVNNSTQSLIAVCDINGIGEVFNINSRDPILTSTKNGHAITDMAFGPNDTIAFSRIPRSGSAIRSNVANGPAQRNLGIESASSESEIEVWSIKTGDKIESIRLPGLIRNIAWDPENGNLVTIDYQGIIRVIDPTNGETRNTLQVEADNIHSVAVLPSERRIVVAGSNALRKVISFDLKSIGQTPLGSGVVNRIAFGPRGALVAELHQDMTLLIWDVETGIELHRESIAFSFDDSRGLGWDPHLIWDHESDHIFLYVKGFKAWQLTAAPPSDTSSLPNITDTGPKYLQLLKPALLRGYHSIYQDIIDRAIEHNPEALVATMHEITHANVSTPSRALRIRLLETHSSQPTNTNEHRNHSLALAHALVGDLTGFQIVYS